MAPDQEFAKKQTQKTTIGATASFTLEPLSSHDADKIFQNSTASKQPNVFPTHEEEPQSSSDVTKPVSQKPETREEPNSALKPGKDTTAILNKEIEVQSKEAADVDNNSKLHPVDSGCKELITCDHQTSAALCFQNSLCFDLD